MRVYFRGLAAFMSHHALYIAKNNPLFAPAAGAQAKVLAGRPACLPCVLACLPAGRSPRKVSWGGGGQVRLILEQESIFIFYKVLSPVKALVPPSCIQPGNERQHIGFQCFTTTYSCSPFRGRGLGVIKNVIFFNPKIYPLFCIKWFISHVRHFRILFIP
jgi:hypothetical protein